MQQLCFHVANEVLRNKKTSRNNTQMGENRPDDTSKGWWMSFPRTSSRLRLLKLRRSPKSDRLSLEGQRVLSRAQRTSGAPSFVRVEGLFGNATGGQRAVFAEDKRTGNAGKQRGAVKPCPEHTVGSLQTRAPGLLTRRPCCLRPVKTERKSSRVVLTGC